MVIFFFNLFVLSTNKSIRKILKTSQYLLIKWTFDKNQIDGPFVSIKNHLSFKTKKNELNIFGI